MTNKRQWTSKEEDAMINILQELVVNGGRYDNGCFRTGTYEHVASKMRERVANINITAYHVQNKIKRLKDKYSTTYDMLKTSGFGWDDTRQCVTVDGPEILKEYLKKHPNKNYTSNRPFPAYERLKIVFGRDRPTGSTVVSATGSTPEFAPNAMDNINLEKEDAEPSFFVHLSTPSNTASASSNPNAGETSLGKRKRNATSAVENITKLIQEGITSFNEDMAKLTAAVTSALANPMTHLREELEAMGLDKMQVIRIGRYFGKNPNELQFWMTLDDSYKQEFVKTIIEE